MANSSFLGDIPGARFGDGYVANASVASNGANARIGQLGPFPHAVRVRHAWWAPTGADAAATHTASYRRLTLRNGGASGTATAIVASLNLTASSASFAPRAMTVDTTVTVASGSVLYFSQETVGGAETNGTVLPAGQFNLAYEVI